MSSAKKFYIRTLGCEKNTIDSEYAAGALVASGCVQVFDPDEADLIVVNTCGFILDAKKQSIESIIEFADNKKDDQQVVITGCLAQRYPDELLKEFPNVSGILGVNSYSKLAEIALGKENNGALNVTCPAPKVYEELGKRTESSVSWTRCIKIAEGCSNICSYCAIPFMRGKYRSRLSEDIIKEARQLASEGCKELVVIAQDVTFYGRDLGIKDGLGKLLRELCKIDGIEWIRLMYCYEDEITDSLIEVMKTEPKICHYIDIPLQHISDKILGDMNRKSTSESIRNTITKLRKQIPDIVIRTTLIVGFPGERVNHFDELYDFVKNTCFERLGAFEFSREEGTKAYSMPGQVRSDVKARRKDRIMELQRGISLKHNQELVGKVLKVLVDEVDGAADNTYIGRTYMDAPDIDNSVIFTSKNMIEPGSFVNVKITDAFDYDLCGEVF